jgi:HEAT repeat protein
MADFETDGNFKRGAFKPIAIAIAVAAVAAGGVAIYMGVKTEKEKVPIEQVAKEKKEIQLLPLAEQMPKWRKWAAQDDERHMRQEAFARLAWNHDKEGLPLIIAGLTSQDHGVRGTAAQAILEYGSPDADSAKAPLLKALAEANNGDKPQICWALAVLHEPTAWDTVLAEYKAGRLASVTRLDGFRAFDAEEMAKMVPLEKIAALAGDDSESVRQLVATTLSKTGDAKWLDVLTRLVGDKEIEVAREASVGLGKIANEQAMKPLLDALNRADKNNRQKFLEALRDGVGGKGLVLAIRSVSHEKAETEKFQMKQIFDMIKDLEDPRVGDALVEWIKLDNPKPHWKTEAGIRMAEVGDTRAAAVLGWRLQQDPLKLYNDIDWPELRRDDNERVISARMLADLAITHPEAREQIRKDAEDQAMFWATDRPQPHANVLRFLVAAESKKIIPNLKKWADPNVQLPKIGETGNFPMEWTTAQSALRYLGYAKDGWSTLEKQLNRKDVKTDASWDSLLQGGMTVLGMTLRALGYGAADGFAHWGDAKAYPILVKHIDDPLQNEQSRTEACFALSWVATDEQMKEVVKKVKDNGADEKKAKFLRGCYLETLIHRPVQDATAALIDMIQPNTEPEVRHQAARAIGMGGVTRAMIPQIFEKLKDRAVKTDAALAILLGADADWAMRAIATYNDDDPAVIEELKEAYNNTFAYWSDRNYDIGDIARWVENAEAVGHVKVRDALQDWTKQLLSRNLVDSIEFDNGPHSMTRVQFRVRLMNDAKGSNAVKRDNAIAILKFMKEKGVLMALRNEQGPVGALAKKAFFEVMNPKAVVDALPAAPKAENRNAVPGAGAQVVPPK